MACIDIRVEFLDERGAIGRACARDLDGDTLCVVDTIAITEDSHFVNQRPHVSEKICYSPSASGVQTRLNTELGDEVLGNIPANGNGGDSSEQSSNRERGGGELHDERWL